MKNTNHKVILQAHIYWKIIKISNHIFVERINYFIVGIFKPLLDYNANFESVFIEYELNLPQIRRDFGNY